MSEGETDEADLNRRDARQQDRDPAVAEILDEIRARLFTAAAAKGVHRDIALAVVEHFAAPHALTLFHEIERLDRTHTGEGCVTLSSPPVTRQGSRARR
jgi:hypothetical protein